MAPATPLFHPAILPASTFLSGSAGEAGFRRAMMRRTSALYPLFDARTAQFAFTAQARVEYLRLGPGEKVAGIEDRVRRQVCAWAVRRALLALSAMAPLIAPGVRA